MAAPYPLTNDQLGKNNYFFATQACVAMGGYLPTAAQLIGAANRVKLDSTIHDSQLTATVQIDKTRGLKDQREMSATLVTTAAGSDAAGSEGVSVGSTGDPAPGRAEPDAVPREPAAGDAPVRHGLRQRERRRVRRLGAGGTTGELPVRVRQDSRRGPGGEQLRWPATMRYAGRAAGVVAALSLLVGCGSTPKQPPPAAGSPQRRLHRRPRPRRYRRGVALPGDRQPAARQRHDPQLPARRRRPRHVGPAPLVGVVRRRPDVASAR